MTDQTPMLRTSERRTFKRCQQQWWWAYREGLRSKHTADPLWFGTGIHQALAEWYCGPGLKRGTHPAETWANFAADSISTAKVERIVDDETEARWVDMSTLGEVLMNEYVEYWGNDDYIHVLAPEMTFAIDIPWPEDVRESLQRLDEFGRLFSDAPSPYRDILVAYRGTFDLPFRDLRDDHVKIGETKTAKTISTGHLTLDDQAGAYWAVARRYLRGAGLIGKNEDIHGIEYNFIKKSLPDDRPQDADGYACNKPEKKHYVAAFGAPSLAANYDQAALAKWKLADLATEAERIGLVVLGERSKVQPAPIFQRHYVHRTRAERATQLYRIQAEAIQMEMIRQGLTEPTKTPDWQCDRFCQFFTMCELHESGMDISEIRSSQYTVQDPYADHRKSTED